jgi:hypothetical protein
MTITMYCALVERDNLYVARGVRVMGDGLPRQHDCMPCHCRRAALPCETEHHDLGRMPLHALPLAKPAR